jgi:hypothetical protein
MKAANDDERPSAEGGIRFWGKPNYCCNMQLSGNSRVCGLWRRGVACWPGPTHTANLSPNTLFQSGSFVFLNFSTVSEALGV